MKNLIFIMAMILCAGLNAQAALPISQYDYNSPENNVSPIAIGMGGLNLTNPGDFYASYSNPALLADNEMSSFVTSFRVANDKPMTFWQAVSISNALQEKQFKYFSLVTKQAAWSYQPMVRIHISELSAAGDSSRYFDYQLDKAQISLAAKDDAWPTIRAGFNLKYINGRLVYLKERRVGSNLIREAFIDDKVKGFSTDLGVTYHQGNFTMGVMTYELFSRLYWENYSSKSLQRRVGASVQYADENLLLTAGLQGKTAKNPDTTYHFGLQNSWTWGGSGNSYQKQSDDQGLVLRLGMYSRDFYGTKNINYTLGTGYNYSIFRFDVSMNNRGMKFSESEYLFSLGVGLP